MVGDGKDVRLLLPPTSLVAIRRPLERQLDATHAIGYAIDAVVHNIYKQHQCSNQHNAAAHQVYRGSKDMYVPRMIP